MACGAPHQTWSSLHHEKWSGNPTFSPGQEVTPARQLSTQPMHSGLPATYGVGGVLFAWPGQAGLEGVRGQLSTSSLPRRDVTAWLGGSAGSSSFTRVLSESSKASVANTKEWVAVWKQCLGSSNGRPSGSKKVAGSFSSVSHLASNAELPHGTVGFARNVLQASRGEPGVADVDQRQLATPPPLPPDDSEEEELNERIRALMGSLEAAVGSRSESEAEGEAAAQEGGAGSQSGAGRRSRRGGSRDDDDVEDTDWWWGEQRTGLEGRRRGRKKAVNMPPPELGVDGDQNTAVSGVPGVGGSGEAREAPGVGTASWPGQGTGGRTLSQDLRPVGMELVWRKKPAEEEQVGRRREKAGGWRGRGDGGRQGEGTVRESGVEEPERREEDAGRASDEASVGGEKGESRSERRKRKIDRRKGQEEQEGALGGKAVVQGAESADGEAGVGRRGVDEDAETRLNGSAASLAEISPSGGVSQEAGEVAQAIELKLQRSKEDDNRVEAEPSLSQNRRMVELEPDRVLNLEEGQSGSDTSAEMTDRSGTKEGAEALEAGLARADKPAASGPEAREVIGKEAGNGALGRVQDEQVPDASSRVLPEAAGRAKLWERTETGWVRKTTAEQASETRGSGATETPDAAVASKGRLAGVGGAESSTRDAGGALKDEALQDKAELRQAAIKEGATKADRPVGAATVGVPLIGDPNQPYQRLAVNLDLELHWARRAGQRGAYPEAQRRLAKCIEGWPGDGRAYVALGKVLQRQGRLKDARKVYEEGCQALRGESAFIWQSWAVLEQRLGNLSRARRLFDAATAADKRHVAAWHGWAMLELKEGNPKKARELLNKGLRLCGASDYLYQSLGMLEAKAGRIEEARTLFLQATRTNRSSVPSWLGWALLEAEHGDPLTARRLFQRAVEASPKNRYAYQAWGLFEAERGNDRNARRLLEVGRDLNPRDPALLQAFALFEYRSGFPGKARELFREAALAAPRYGPLWRAWGWMEWREGRLETARELYEKAALADPNSPRVYQAWGVLEERAGNTGLARELFKRALKVDPGNTPTWLSWAAMEESLGNSVRADELRSLCLQQRTEVVESTWEFSDMLGPALERMRSFFNFDMSRRNPLPGTLVRKDSEGEEEAYSDEEDEGDKFDLEAFLADKVKPRFSPPMSGRAVWKKQMAPEEVLKAQDRARRFNQRQKKPGAPSLQGEGDPRLGALRRAGGGQRWSGGQPQKSATQEVWGEESDEEGRQVLAGPMKV